MPAPRPSHRQSVSQQLANAAPLTMPLDMMELERYYRRANLLLQQVQTASPCHYIWQVGACHLPDLRAATDVHSAER